MKLEGDQPIVEGIDNPVLIADALYESVPVNNRQGIIDPDTEAWNNRVDNAIEALEDTFGIYRQDGAFHIDNGESWINPLGEVDLYMPVGHLRRAIELHKDCHRTEEERVAAAEKVLLGIRLIMDESLAENE